MAEDNSPDQIGDDDANGANKAKNIESKMNLDKNKMVNRQKITPEKQGGSFNQGLVGNKYKKLFEMAQTKREKTGKSIDGSEEDNQSFKDLINHPNLNLLTQN